MTDEAVGSSQAGAPSSVAVLGAGSWGTALAVLLAANGHAVRLWARDPALAAALEAERRNSRYLPAADLAETISPTADLAAAVTQAAVVVFAIPSGAMREVTAGAASRIGAQTLLLSAAKGLEVDTGLRMSQVLAQTIPNAEARTVALSGPNLAVEMARGVPTASVAASIDPDAALAAQQLFSRQARPTFRVYTGRDVVGVELGGAIKNAIAIGAGVCDGLGYGDNAKAALMTRGLAEAVRLGAACGAEPQTFMGLSGVGDLIATGGSRLSRNYRVGYGLGQGRALPEILEELGQVAEGVPTTHVLCALAQRNGIEMPLCMALHRVLFEKQGPSLAIQNLMLRPLKDEGQ